MKPKMYIFINKGLGMSPGKIAAQAAINTYGYEQQPEPPASRPRRALRWWMNNS